MSTGVVVLLFLLILVVVLWYRETRRRRNAECELYRTLADVYEGFANRWQVKSSWVQDAFENLHLGRERNFWHWDRKDFLFWYKRQFDLYRKTDFVPIGIISEENSSKAVDDIFVWAPPPPWRRGFCFGSFLGKINLMNDINQKIKKGLKNLLYLEAFILGLILILFLDLKLNGGSPLVLLWSPLIAVSYICLWVFLLVYVFRGLINWKNLEYLQKRNLLFFVLQFVIFYYAFSYLQGFIKFTL